MPAYTRSYFLNSLWHDLIGAFNLIFKVIINIARVTILQFLFFCFISFLFLFVCLLLFHLSVENFDSISLHDIMVVFLPIKAYILDLIQST